MKFIMTWMGVTSGSHLGRDDGYPEQKFRVINSLDELVDTYQADATYYQLHEVDVSSIVKLAKELKNEVGRLG